MPKNLPKQFLEYVVNQHAEPEAVWEHMQAQYAFALYTRISNFVEDITATISADKFLETFVDGEYYGDKRLWKAEQMTDLSVAGLWTAFDLLANYFATSDLNKKDAAGFRLRVEVAAAIISYRAEGQTDAPIAMLVDSSDGQYYGIVFNEDQQQVDLYDLESDTTIFCEATGVPNP
jgi:hypothetical protein